MFRRSFRPISLLASLVTLALVASCGGDDGPAAPNNDDDDDDLLPGEVDSSGGTVQLASGAVVVAVPAGAVTSTVQLTATPTTGPASEVAVGAYEMGPDGTQFANPVTLTFSYDPGTLPGDVTEDELRMYSASGGAWDLIAGSSVNTGANTVSGQVTSFSTYGILGQIAASIAVAPTSAGLDLGGTASFTATVTSTIGESITRTITWTSSDEDVATVDASGTVTGVGEGEATITATYGEFSAEAAVTVTIPVASVEVAPSEATIAPAATVQLTATPKDASGNDLDRPVDWSSSDGAVAAVDDNGLVTGGDLGTARITATSGGVEGFADITVEDNIANVEVAGQIGLLFGTTTQLTATVTRESGNEVSNPSITWASSDEAVLTVDGSGVVTGVAPGVATITATVEGVEGTFEMTITIDWNALAGTWTGSWTNTTFSSTGAVGWEVTVDIPTLTATFIIDMDGNVFGVSNPAPLTVEGTLGAETAGGSVDAPLHGPVSVTAGADDISFSSTSVPTAGIEAWTSSGSVADGVYTGTFTITFTGGGGAAGTVTVTQEGG